MDLEASETEIFKSQEDNSKMPSSAPVESPSSREDANSLSLANSDSIHDAEEKTESQDESENETASGNAKAAPVAAEVIELLDDDDDGDAEMDTVNSQPDAKRQKTAVDAAQASLELRKANMPDWMSMSD